MSNFAFLHTEWRALHESTAQAKAQSHPDARTACFHARRTLELFVHWVDGVFSSQQVDQLIPILDDVKQRASA
jgi:hypothetical protein